ncbi:MAG: inorganic phosphate transporter [Pirellulaceae bacterium]
MAACPLFRDYSVEMMFDFIAIAALVGLGMLIWDCIEVGRNDAANLVNAVFGARVMTRRLAVAIAGAAVIAGATFSSPVMETARKGIFEPHELTVRTALTIYVSVYFVDTLLLYGFSGFGMPVSTTACLVFELLGAALFLAGFENIHWSKVGDVVTAIVMSIAVSGIAAFLIMRVFRGAVRDRAKDRDTILLHGPWISGAILTWLMWFMVFKGLKRVEAIDTLKEHTFAVYGEFPVLIMTWGALTLLVHLLLVATHQFGHKYLFSATAVLGMLCMAFAFGQNDLANAASPGLSGLALWKSGFGPNDLANIASEIPISLWALFGCGTLMAFGMFTREAQRVTRAQVNTGSQFDQVALYAPRWCRWVARTILRVRPHTGSLAPEPTVSEGGKKMHYDTLRASVITGVSASVIAFASGRGLPVSTTYVAFAAVLGSGMADRVFARGEADLKVGRAIWVITCWFLAPAIGVVGTGCLATVLYHLSVFGLAVCLVLNITVRYYCRIRADAHEEKYHHSRERNTGEK